MAEAAVKRGPGRPSLRNKKFREEEKIPFSSKVNRVVEKPRIKCRVYNQEHPGRDIVGCVNNKKGVFVIQDGAEVELTQSQIEALQHSIIETTKYEEVEPGRFIVKPITIQRFTVVPLNIFPPKKAVIEAQQ